MKNSVVRTTFLDGLLNMFLPYYCRGCGRTGTILCEDCRREIEVIGRVKSGVVEKTTGRKEVELGELDELYIGGWREGALKKLIEDYKFKSVKKIAPIFAELLDEAVPEKTEAIIVPLPTVARHIRERGFDHTKRLAEEFAKLRGLEMREVLRRVNKTVQVGADEEMRRKQAAEAYAVDGAKFEPGKAYLLLDDVWTTGASMRAAAEKLRQAGAERIFGAVVSLNPASDR